MTSEELYWLLLDEQTWGTVLEQLALGREDAGVLYDNLMRELTQRQEGSRPCGNLSEEESMFLLEFPSWKQQLEKLIGELHSIADQVDTKHKMLTKASLVASSSGAVAAVLTLLGVALAPATAGESLVFSAAGQGLGVAAVATNILISILESKSNSAARDRASGLVARPATLEAGIGLFEVGTAGFCVGRCADTLMSIRQLRAYQGAHASPGFLGRDRNLVATSRVLFWKSAGTQRAAGVPVLAMTRGARMLSAAGAGFLLVREVRSIQQTLKHLEEGARAETAQDLRTRAWELERELQQQSQRYTLAIQRLAGSWTPTPEAGRRATRRDANQLVRPSPWSLGLAEAECNSPARNASARHRAPRKGARRPAAGHGNPRRLQKHQGPDQISVRSDALCG